MLDSWSAADSRGVSCRRGTRTGDEEVSVLLQGFAVLADHVVQTQVQLVKGESLLRVGSGFSRRVVVGFLRKRVSPVVSCCGNLC